MSADLYTEDDRGMAVNQVDAILRVAYALEGLTAAVSRLGNADAATPLGGLEAHGKMVKEAGEAIAGALDGIRSVVDT